MSKFPMLANYRIVAIILAVIAVIFGVISAISTATISIDYGQRTRFDLGTFLVVLFPFLIGAFFLAVVAELILLALRIEDHLDVMRSLQEKDRNITRARDQNPDEWIPPTVKARHEIDTPESFYRIAQENDQGVTLKATVIRYQTVAMQTPNQESLIFRGAIKKGTELTLFGRTPDSSWVEVEGSGRSWVEAAHLQIQGDVMTLPIIEPA